MNKKKAAASIANPPTMDAAEKTANYVAIYGGQGKLASDKSTHQTWSREDTNVIRRKVSQLLAASKNRITDESRNTSTLAERRFVQSNL